jgi:drug/metabolite transporter (DMT)-like permease
VKYLPLILAGVLLNALAQLVLKLGMKSIGFFEFSTSSIVPVGIKIIRSPYIITGISCYVLSVMVWLLALSRVDVSFAYPMTSLGYIFTCLAGFLFLQETISSTRIIGILVIMLGVYLVARS